MSKRNIAEIDQQHQSPLDKKMKFSNTQIALIPDDVWTQNIFQHMTGNELFTSCRLVSTTWNELVKGTKCNIELYLPADQGKKIILDDGLFKNVKQAHFKSKVHPSVLSQIVNMNWQSLQTLNVSGCEIGAEGVKALANGKLLALTSLNLNGNDIGSEGVKYLSEGNIKGLTSLDILNNNIEETGAQYLLTGNLKGLSHLNYQDLNREDGDDCYFATTAHFCGDTPFTAHQFESSDELKEYLFEYYLDYWCNYGRDALGINDDELDDDEVLEKKLLRAKVYQLSFGKIADLAVVDVGSMVYNECERESVVATVYGRKLDLENYGKINDSTPIVMVCKRDGYDFKMKQVVGKKDFLKALSEFVEIEEEDGDEESFEKIEEKVNEGDGEEDCCCAIFIGEAVTQEFVELKKK